MSDKVKQLEMNEQGSVEWAVNLLGFGSHLHAITCNGLNTLWLIDQGSTVDAVGLLIASRQRLIN